MSMIPPDDFEVPAAGLRMVIAAPEGVTTDRNDIKAVRIGHASGFTLITAATEPGVWQFAGCGIEWLCNDGHIERQSVAEAMVEVLAPGVIAIACRAANSGAEK